LTADVLAKERDVVRDLQIVDEKRSLACAVGLGHDVALSGLGVAVDES
jgi:hypothetical protein